MLEAAALARSLNRSLHILHVRSRSEQVDDGSADEARHSVLQQALNLVSAGSELAVTKEVVVARSRPGAIVKRARTVFPVVLGAKGAILSPPGWPPRSMPPFCIMHRGMSSLCADQPVATVLFVNPLHGSSDQRLSITGPTPGRAWPR